MSGGRLRIGVNLGGLEWLALEPGDRAMLQALTVATEAPTSEVELVLYAPGRVRALQPLFARMEHHVLPTPGPLKLLRPGTEAAWLRGAARAHGLDAVHDLRPGASTPIGVPRLVSVHSATRADLDRVARRIPAGRPGGRALTNADVVIAPTVGLADRLVAEAGVPADRIHLVPWPVPETDEPMPIDTVRARFGVIGRIVLLDATQAGPDQVAAWIRVMKYLGQRHVETTLVVVGTVAGHPDVEQAVTDLGMDARVARLAECRPSVWSALVRNAELVAAPSVTGAFCSGALEAMWFGVPVIAEAGSPAAEVADSAAAVHPPGDEAAITLEVHRILSDPASHRSRSEAGRAVATDFTARRTLEELVAAYRSVLVPL